MHQLRSRTGDPYAWTGHFNENKAGVANGLNQLTSFGAKSLTHDSKGNVTAFGTKAFTYSSENLLGAREDQQATRALRMAETTGRPLGSAGWVAELEASSGRTLAPRKRGPKSRAAASREAIACI